MHRRKIGASARRRTGYVALSTLFDPAMRIFYKSQEKRPKVQARLEDAATRHREALSAVNAKK
jgi:hypothetical protein